MILYYIILYSIILYYIIHILIVTIMRFKLCDQMKYNLANPYNLISYPLNLYFICLLIYQRLLLHFLGTVVPPALGSGMLLRRPDIPAARVAANTK